MKATKKYVLFLAVVLLALVTLRKPFPTLTKEPMKAPHAHTIFVSVASYRDDDCSHTLKSMYDNAHFPERVFAGVCQQNKEGEPSEECIDPGLTWRKNVRVITIPHTDAKGPTYARYKCASLYQNETYFCQIDSHTTFVKGWDVMIIEDLQKCPSPQPVISYYPHDSKSNASDVSSVPVLCKSKFNNDSLLTFEAVTMEAAQGTPRVIPFLAGGFFVGPGRLVKDVPYDPSLDHLFNGEEIAFSARMWTSGYDFYAPLRNYVFHFYGRKEKPKFWNDHLTGYEDAQKQSQHKVVRLLGLDGHPPLQNYRWGLGTARSLEEYLEFAGIDPKAKNTSSENKFCS
jgi:hypothetical protein